MPRSTHSVRDARLPWANGFADGVKQGDFVKKRISTISSMIFAAVLCLVLCLALAGCGGETTVNRLISDYGITVDGGDFDKDASLVAAPPARAETHPREQNTPCNPKITAPVPRHGGFRMSAVFPRTVCFRQSRPLPCLCETICRGRFLSASLRHTGCASRYGKPPPRDARPITRYSD